MSPDIGIQQLLDTVVAHGDPEPVTEPFTGNLLAEMPQMSAADIDCTFERARDIQPAWAATPVSVRAKIVGRLLDTLYHNRGRVLDTLQAEGGKSRFDAVTELGEALLAVRHHVNTAATLLAPQKHRGMVPVLSSARVVHHPHGVVVVIAPWNFPLALAAVDALPALIAGNSVILKADTQTALSVLLLRKIAIDAGVPADAFQVVFGRRSTIGESLLANADFIAFTGSTAAGRAIGRRAGERLIGCSLELGGKNPMIVLPDADLERTAKALPRASFGNAGQLCMTAERLYVHENVADELIERAIHHTRELTMGASYDFTHDMGSITTAANFDRLQKYVGQAIDSGAEVLTGGKARPDLGPQFFEPTILTGVTSKARMHTEEVFGPVVCVYTFRTTDEAIDLANDSEYGLSASIWTKDTDAARDIGTRLRAGGVNINDGYTAAFGAHTAPAGGMKASGIGRRHGTAGLLRYIEPQTIAAQRIASMDSRFGLPRTMHGALMEFAMGPMKYLR